VNSIEQTFISIRDIANYHGLVTTHANLLVGHANLAINNRIAESHENISMMIRDLTNQVKAITVAFSRQSDFQETAALLHQRPEEDLDQVAFTDGAASGDLRRGNYMRLGFSTPY
jgi:mitochondrial fission protein ELM1